VSCSKFLLKTKAAEAYRESLAAIDISITTFGSPLSAAVCAVTFSSGRQNLRENAF
jgi:hypothetical protein